MLWSKVDMLQGKRVMLWCKIDMLQGKRDVLWGNGGHAVEKGGFQGPGTQ